MAALGGKLVLFGGYHPSVGDLNDTWEWDGTNWTERTSGSAPSPRSGASMATLGDKVVLFGGFTLNGPTETWEWNGSVWQKKITPLSPAARSHAAMAAHEGKVVLFGGSWGGTYRKDTWTYDGTEWTEHVVTPSPPDRSGHAMVTLGSTVVLYGGYKGGNFPLYRGDTWTWDGTAWTSRGSGPPPRIRVKGGALGDHAYIFGGAYGNNAFSDLWDWDGTGWAQVTRGQGPTGGATLASFGNKVLAFHGLEPGSVPPDHGITGTWEYDGTEWTKKFPATSPPARYDVAMAPRGDRVALFGGLGLSDYLRDTWEWDGTNWTLVAEDGPAARGSHELASYGSSVLLFGGRSRSGGSGVYYNDTWEWDGVDWARRALSGPPAQRWGHLMTEVAGEVLLAGGKDLSGDFYDTWVWTGSTWSARTGHFDIAGASTMAALEDSALLRRGLQSLERTGGAWVDRGSPVLSLARSPRSATRSSR